MMSRNLTLDQIKAGGTDPGIHPPIRRGLGPVDDEYVVEAIYKGLSQGPRR